MECVSGKYARLGWPPGKASNPLFSGDIEVVTTEGVYDTLWHVVLYTEWQPQDRRLFGSKRTEALASLA